MKILRHLGRQNSELGITFVDDRTIAALNQKYRHQKKATDVLSFPMESRTLLGDIVVSVDTASRQAAEQGISQRSRIVFLIIHGLLHLLGYDHVKTADWKKMARMEKQLTSLCQKK